MVNSIIDLVCNHGYENVIIDDKYTFSCRNDARVHIIRDPRSAVFFALGLYKQGIKRIAFIVDEDFISSAYTSLTECWFQRIPLLIVTINSSFNHNLEYLDRCTDFKINLQDINEIDSALSSYSEFYAPGIIRIHNKVINKCTDFSTIINLVDELGYNHKVFVYDYEYNGSISNVVSLSRKYKFGAFSKYIAYNYVNEALLCVPSSYFNYDVNVINCRYITDKFKAIVLDDGGSINFEEWLMDNNIKVIEITKDKLRTGCSDLISAKKATLLYVK